MAHIHGDQKPILFVWGVLGHTLNIIAIYHWPPGGRINSSFHSEVHGGEIKFLFEFTRGESPLEVDEK